MPGLFHQVTTALKARQSVAPFAPSVLHLFLRFAPHSIRRSKGIYTIAAYPTGFSEIRFNRCLIPKIRLSARKSFIGVPCLFRTSFVRCPGRRCCPRGTQGFNNSNCCFVGSCLSNSHLRSSPNRDPWPYSQNLRPLISCTFRKRHLDMVLGGLRT